MVADAIDVNLAVRTLVAGFKPIPALGVVRRSRSGPVLAARRGADEELYWVKWLVPSIAYDQQRIRQIRGDIARLLGVVHAGIGEVHALHETPQGAIVVSLLVDGVTLRSVLNGGALTPEAVAVLATDVMDALAWAHQSGVLHRDLCPDSIVIDNFGAVHLVDIGIAAPVYAYGMTAGTPAYIAPELWEDQRPTQQSDLYALATMLFEAGVGHTPFVSARATAIRAKHLRGVVDLSAVVQPLRDVIAAGLARDPRQRPVSAGQWRQDWLAAAQQIAPEWSVEGRRALAAAALAASSKLPAPDLSAELVSNYVPDEPAGRNRRRWIVAGLAGAAALAVGVVALAGFMHGGTAQPAGTPQGSSLGVASPLATLTPPPTATPTPSPSSSPTPTPSPTPSPTPRATPSAVQLNTPTPTATPTPTPTATATATSTPSPN